MEQQQQQRQQPVFRTSFQTIDNTVAGANSSYLYFRRFLGPRDSSGGQFFSLEPAVTTDPSIRINLHNSTGSIISTGYLYDTVINPPTSSYNPDALFSTVTVTGDGTPQTILNIVTASSYFGLVDPGLGGPLTMKYLDDSNTGNGPSFLMCKSRGSGATSLPGDILGIMNFYGSNMTPTYSLGASIAAVQTGVALTGVPTALLIATTDFAGATGERMRINESGFVGIGNPMPYVRLQTVVDNKTALEGIAANSDDVNTIIGAYNAGPYTGLNVGSVQATSNDATFNNYKLALNPRGGDVYMGDGSITCHVYGDLDVSGTGYIASNLDVGPSGLIHADVGAGRVGILQPAPAYTLDVSGSINVGPGGNYYLNGVPLSTGAAPQLYYANFSSTPTYNFNSLSPVSSLFSIPTALTTLLSGATVASTGSFLIQFTGYAVPSGIVSSSPTFTYSVTYNSYTVSVTATKQSTITILTTGTQSIYPIDMTLVIPLANFTGYNTDIGLTITPTSLPFQWYFILSDAVLITYYPADIPCA